MSLYTSWSDHRADEAARIAAQSSEVHEKARVDLVAVVGTDRRSVAFKDEKHDLSDAAFAFPKALGIATRKPAGDPVIDAGWFDDVLLKLTDGGSDDRSGRLPVLVTVSYWDGDVARTSNAIYDVVWKTSGRLLRGRVLRLEGAKLRQRGGSQATLDAAWAREKP